MDKSKYTPAGGYSQPRRLAWYAHRMSKNLVENWVAAEAAAGRNRTEALKRLNASCQTRYRLNRTYEWEHKTVEIPPTPRDYMVRVALPHVLAEIGIKLSAADLRKLADHLS
jgi:hypothetical protein